LEKPATSLFSTEELLFYPEEEGSTFLRIVGRNILSYMASHPGI
jgi:hypothetical protein